MTYTHYYKFILDNNLNKSSYNNALEDVIILINKYQKDYNLDIYNNIEYDDKIYKIIFNGPEGDKCEYFKLPEACNIEFDFCKTAKKSYDDIVVACLIIMSHVFNFKVNSDGNKNNWLKGQKLVIDTFGDKYNNIYVNLYNNKI